MAQFVDLFPSLAPGPEMGPFPHDGPVRIEVPVFFLRLADQGDQRIDRGPEKRVGESFKGVGGSFDDLVDIRIVEGVEGAEVTPQQSRRNPEIIDAPRFAAFAQGTGNGDPVVGFNAACPETVADLHLREGHRLDGVICMGISCFPAMA